MNKARMIILTVLFIVITVGQACAGDFDGSKPLVCAVIETFECGPTGECLPGTAEDIGIPQFLKTNFKKKTISGTLKSGEVRTTTIKNMERSNGNLILQGVQNGKGWSVVIIEATGKMTVTASDGQVGFVVFGACTPQ